MVEGMSIRKETHGCMDWSSHWGTWLQSMLRSAMPCIHSGFPGTRDRGFCESSLLVNVVTRRETAFSPFYNPQKGKEWIVGANGVKNWQEIKVLVSTPESNTEFILSWAFHMPCLICSLYVICQVCEIIPTILLRTKLTDKMFINGHTTGNTWSQDVTLVLLTQGPSCHLIGYLTWVPGRIIS